MGELNEAFRVAGAAVLLLACAACSGTPKTVAVAQRSQCEAAGAAFVSAEATVTGNAPAPDAYWTALHQPGSDAAAAAHRVTTDIAAYDSAIAQLQTSYAGLRQCRVDHGEASAAASDLDAAHQAAAAVTQRATLLRGAADRLVAESPTSRVRVAKALAAPLPPAQPYIAVSAATITARPADGALSIADLRKGVRVTGPGGDAAPGWTALTLNDGSTGYVRSEMLRPVALNRSAQIAADQAKRLRDGSGDPVVALALAARETLPEHSAAFAALVDAAANPSVASVGPAAGTVAR